MNQLVSLGVILLLALAAGHLVKFIRVPEVTGYLLAGVALGPSGLGWINSEALAGLNIFSEVALALILFSIGAVFQFDQFRRIARNAVTITVAESCTVAVLMALAMRALGQDWPAAALLAVIAMETAAASSLMVMREANAAGPMSDTLLGLLAINNLLCLTAFLIVVSVINITAQGGTAAVWSLVAASAFTLAWQLVGSAALGYLIGLLLAGWATRVVEHGEVLILLIGCILLGVGLSLALHLSTLVTSLAIGATVVNVSMESRNLFQVQSRTDPPFYAIFFVIAGANLHVEALKSIGLIGVVYVIVRGAAKVTAGIFAARKSSLPLDARNNIPFTLLPHAGLAVGLALLLIRRLPEMASTVTTVVLSAVLIYEVVGPFTTKLAIVRAGEAHGEEREEAAMSPVE